MDELIQVSLVPMGNIGDPLIRAARETDCFELPLHIPIMVMNEINSKKPLDDHDNAIIAQLREDGRMAVRTLAERVGLNEATVRTRIRRLEQAGIMRVVARVDLGSAGYPFSALVGLRIKGRSIDEVGAELLTIPEAISVLSVIGRNDLEIQLIARSMEELNSLLTERIPAIPGVISIEAALALKIHKYVQPWGRFDEGN